MAPEQVMIFDEVERQFLSEFDYRREAAQLAQARANLAAFARDVAVPRPLPHLCTPAVLVMEYLPGPKLRDGIRAHGERYAAARGVTLAALEAEMRASFAANGLPPPYSGPSAAQIEGYRTLLRVTAAVVNAPARLVNAAATWLLGPVAAAPRGGDGAQEPAAPPPAPRRWLPLYEPNVPLNGAAIMDTLLKVSAHQIFVDGYVQADPHGGNFLLLPDGRIG